MAIILMLLQLLLYKIKNLNIMPSSRSYMAYYNQTISLILMSSMFMLGIGSIFSYMCLAQTTPVPNANTNSTEGNRMEGANATGSSTLPSEWAFDDCVRQGDC